MGLQVVFFGEGDIEPSKEHAIELARQACRSNFLSQVIFSMLVLAQLAARPENLQILSQAPFAGPAGEARQGKARQGPQSAVPGDVPLLPLRTPLWLLSCCRP